MAFKLDPVALRVTELDTASIRQLVLQDPINPASWFIPSLSLQCEQQPGEVISHYTGS